MRGAGGFGALRRPATVALVLVLMLLAGASALAARPAAGKTARHTERRAEINVLRSIRVLRRLRPGLVDARTHLLHVGVQAKCAGEGARAVAYHRFRCRVRYRKSVVLLAYVAAGDGAWRLRALRLHRG